MAALEHSIWLTLDAASEARLSAVIDPLAAEYGRPAFRPHVTFLGDLASDWEATAAAVDALDWPAARAARVRGVDWGGTYFTAIFLELEVAPEMFTLRDGVARALTGAAPKPYTPHASLAYGPIEAAEKARLIEGFRAEFAGAEFELAEVSVVSSSVDTPIEDWKPLWAKALAPG